ncbi:MAG: hypothetical protein LBC40_07480 [Dysgonamonadaceae bacterium]|jgi:hypothetical protein|nr:hypothetical protein [Dysgonamonadaceae bacterium]
MDLLEISRESAYRRLRGDVPFSIEEISKLALELDFSIDELIRESKDRLVFFGPRTPAKDFSHAFQIMLQKTYYYIQRMTQAQEAESLVVINHIPPVFTVYFEHLFRFLYYRWLHQNRKSSLNYCFADVIIPQEITELQKKIKFAARSLSNTYIFDPNIILNLISVVQYYYRRKLLSEKELDLLVEDILSQISLFEKIAQTGYSDYKTARCDIFLSSISIEGNSNYIRFDQSMSSYYFTDMVNSIIISDEQICTMHKEWIESLKKYSTLITQSGEILQSEYFEQQRANVLAIRSETPFYR